jgi:hypothetical protein
MVSRPGRHVNHNLSHPLLVRLHADVRTSTARSNVLAQLDDAFYEIGDLGRAAQRLLAAEVLVPILDPLLFVLVQNHQTSPYPVEVELLGSAVNVVPLFHGFQGRVALAVIAERPVLGHRVSAISFHFFDEFVNLKVDDVFLRRDLLQTKPHLVVGVIGSEKPALRGTSVLHADVGQVFLTKHVLSPKPSLGTQCHVRAGTGHPIYRHQPESTIVVRTRFYLPT